MDQEKLKQMQQTADKVMKVFKEDFIDSKHPLSAQEMGGFLGQILGNILGSTFNANKLTLDDKKITEITTHTLEMLHRGTMGQIKMATGVDVIQNILGKVLGEVVEEETVPKNTLLN